MAVTVRRAGDRGVTDVGWFKAFHSFSSGAYYDPRHIGFGVLRELNEIRLDGGRTLGARRDADREILTYVAAGALRCDDGLGGVATLPPGGLLRVSAGSGLAHHVANASTSEPAIFFRLVILPERRGLTPSAERRVFPAEDRRGALRVIASGAPAAGAAAVNRDVALSVAALAAGQGARAPLGGEREAWVQILSGVAEVNGVALSAGDGAALQDEPELSLIARAETEALVLDMTRDG